MAGHGTDRANRQAVVTTQHDRQLPGLQRGIDRVTHRLVPGHCFGQVAEAVEGALPGVGGAVQVAAVVHRQAQPLQRLLQPRHPHRLRPHTRAAHAGPDVGGHTNQADGGGRAVGGHGRAFGWAAVNYHAACDRAVASVSHAPHRLLWAGMGCLKR